jgi:hypothetical protein
VKHQPEKEKEVLIILQKYVVRGYDINNKVGTA